MPAFQRVEGNRAGPQALGILVPPGVRTLVILRPRALGWDLLPMPREGAEAFCEFDRDDAAGLARRVQAALAANAANGRDRLQPLPQPGGYHLGRVLAGFLWIVCRRLPGQPYRPMLFATREDALHAAEQLASFLCPLPDANQEYYFNTQSFSPVPLDDK